MDKKHIFEDGRWSNLDIIPPCEKCEHCTDTIFDYTTGDYLWLCNITDEGHYANEYDLATGMRTKCPLSKQIKVKEL